MIVSDMFNSGMNYYLSVAVKILLQKTNGQKFNGIDNVFREYTSASYNHVHVDFLFFFFFLR